MTSSPDWLQALAHLCEQTSQAEVARMVGVSRATVSLLLRGAYAADTARMEAKIRAILAAEVRSCPVFGVISITRCYAEQTAPYYPSPIRSDLYRACRSCTHRALTPKEAS